ncbi:hypothetical protein GCM10011515_16720 [Tsuneonella deserti]|uniref:Lipoprotein n=1 Tax=Tsuneonella deserti TaxID=2035528 RepID=A0ABQ1S794_9SPHN|nr:hypothetical protein [Tsuneonella deserti]GGD97590.1 hypothetical protein GCM10011515_16720 [Tsuneonella deserti]
MRPAVALLPLALLGGCVETIAESRVRSALVEAGLSQGNADCMAGRMVDRLTIAQLRKLEALKARPGAREKPVTIGEYIERVRRVGDSEVIAVTASSAGLCAAGLG